MNGMVASFSRSTILDRRTQGFAWWIPNPYILPAEKSTEVSGLLFLPTLSKYGTPTRSGTPVRVYWK
jgi:hypothetical protein